MSLIPNFVEGRVLLNFKKVSRVIQDFHGAEAFCAASPNDRLGILEVLSAGRLTAAKTAPQINAIVEL